LNITKNCFLKVFYTSKDDIFIAYVTRNKKKSFLIHPKLQKWDFSQIYQITTLNTEFVKNQELISIFCLILKNFDTHQLLLHNFSQTLEYNYNTFLKQPQK